MRPLTAALCTIAIIAGAIKSTWSQEILKVAIPQSGAWDAGIAELGQSAGIFKRHGLKLEIHFVPPDPERMEAVVGGGIEIATTKDVSAAVGAFAKGAPVRIISSEMIGAPDLYWYVRTGSPIQKLDDFNGKTVAFTMPGSMTQVGLLELAEQFGLSVLPTSTGTIAASITQTMSGQVDVGFGVAPFGLDLLEEGKIRIIATGNEVASLRTRTTRVNLANANSLQNRHDAIARFNRAYQETVDWMYSDPAALRRYGQYSALPANVVLRMRDLIPKESLATDPVQGINQIMANFVPSPLTAEQVKELVQIPR